MSLGEVSYEGLDSRSFACSVWSDPCASSVLCDPCTFSVWSDPFFLVLDQCGRTLTLGLGLEKST